MKSLIIPGVPGRTLMRLRRRARVNRRSVSEEVIAIIGPQLRLASALAEGRFVPPTVKKR